MRTTRTVTIRGGLLARWCLLARGVSLPGALIARGVSLPGGVPCDLSHHAFDVTCMLPPHQLRPTNCAAAYIVWPGCMLGYHPPPSPPVDRITDTCKNITFPQLRLQAVKNNKHQTKFAFACAYAQCECTFRFHSHCTLVIALQKSDSLVIAVLAKAMGLNRYSTLSLAKICMHRFG